MQEIDVVLTFKFSCKVYQHWKIKVMNYHNGPRKVENLEKLNGPKTKSQKSYY